MQQVVQLTTLNCTAEQQHASKVEYLSSQLQAAVVKLVKLESELAVARQAAADRARPAQPHNYSNDDNDEDDQQCLQVEKSQSSDMTEQQKQCDSGLAAAGYEDGKQMLCNQTMKRSIHQGNSDNPRPCMSCKEASEQVTALTEQLKDAQSRVAVLQAELSAARQQAGLECGSAVWARQQVKDLSKQLQQEREQVAQHGRDAEESKQQEAEAKQQLQMLVAANAALQAHLQEADAAAASAAAAKDEALKQFVMGTEMWKQQVEETTRQTQLVQEANAALQGRLQEADAAAAKAAAAKAEATERMMQLQRDADKCEQQAAEAGRQVKVLQEIDAALQGRLQESAAVAAAAAQAEAAAAAVKVAEGRRSVVERSVKAKAWVRQHVAELRRSAVQLQRQLDEANAKVRCLGPGLLCSEQFPLLSGVMLQMPGEDAGLFACYTVYYECVQH
jgi:hypothetical protein